MIKREVRNLLGRVGPVMVGMFWVLVAGQTCNAQATLQVASKTFNTVVNGPVRELHINAEKADIELIAWDKPEISVSMELSARHPDKAMATKDLGKLQYLADKSGRDYYLRNYILLKDGESKPVSNLKTKYTIYLPVRCAVDLKNTFGTIIMKGLSTNIQLKADFCTTSLWNLKGNGAFETTFGDLKTSDVAGRFTFISDHTNLRLEGIGGAIKLNTSYGLVEILPSTALTSLGIQSRKATVNLSTRNWQMFDYKINSAYSQVQLPNGFRWKRNTVDFKDAFFAGKNQVASVQINAEFGNIMIK